jgi:hypothetical protein
MSVFAAMMLLCHGQERVATLACGSCRKQRERGAALLFTNGGGFAFICEFCLSGPKAPR